MRSLVNSVLFLFVLLFMAVNAAAEQTEGSVDALFEAGKGRYVLGWIENGVWAGLLGGSLPKTEADHRVEAIFVEAFSCRRLIPLFKKSLSNTIHAETRAGARAFFTSREGRKAAESWVDMSFANSPYKIKRFFMDLPQIDPARMKLLKSFEQSCGFSEIRWSIIKSPLIGIIRGNASLAGEDSPLAEERAEEAWSMEIDYNNEFYEKCSLACIAYQYRNLTDEELSALVAFSQSETGMKYYSGFRRSLEELLQGISRYIEAEIIAKLAPKRKKRI